MVQLENNIDILDRYGESKFICTYHVGSCGHQLKKHLSQLPNCLLRNRFDSAI